MAEKISRHYGDEQNFSDILFNKKNGTVFFKINLGVFGQKTFILEKRDDDTYDVLIETNKKKKKDKAKLVKIAQTFPVKNKEKKVVKGITKGVLSLSTKYDSEKKKEVNANNNAIFFTTHKLKETKKINDDFVKVGFITGVFGVEKPSDDNSKSSNKDKSPEYETVYEEIPF